MNIRKLCVGDEEMLENFLKNYADTSMFLRSNLLASGLTNQNKPFEGVYFASFDNSNKINGVLVHYWNGNLMMQCPDLNSLNQLVEFFKQNANSSIAGILGDDAQATKVISLLNFSTNDFAVNHADDLFALRLSQMKQPHILNKNDYVVLEANKINTDLMKSWLKLYQIEALGAEDNETLEESIQQEISNTERQPERYILMYKGCPVALCGFNAVISDMVQLGSVWTPKEFRGNGFARVLIYQCLNLAQKRGVKRAILFTNNDAAIRVYQSLNFEKTGAFRLGILKKPIHLNR